MIRSVDEIVQDLSAKPLPVIFLDTCIYLDLIRTIIRDNLHTAYLKDGNKLLNSANISIYILTSQIVEKEWSNNLKTVSQEIETKLKSLHKSVSKYLEVAQFFKYRSFSLNSTTNFISLVDPMKTLAENLLNTSIKIQKEDRFSVSAMERVIKSEPPSKRGKSGAKDCYIIEQVIELSNKLRAKSFSEKIVFTTSNTRDYLDEHMILKSPLDTQFASNNLSFATNLSWALSIIKV